MFTAVAGPDECALVRSWGCEPFPWAGLKNAAWQAGRKVPAGLTPKGSRDTAVPVKS